MPQFTLTDTASNPVEGSQFDWTSASSLFRFLEAKTLHFLIVPDYLVHKDEPLSAAIPKPVSFNLTASNTFTLGAAQPEVRITPGTSITLRANATPGADLFLGDPFRVPATVLPSTGYVGLSLTGSLALGLSGSAGELTFGFNAGSSVTFEYDKAFLTGGPGEPTLLEATREMVSHFIIPASFDDLKKLSPGDVCTVSGTGSLKVTGGFTIATPVNPLASVNLPFNAGAVEVQDGAIAGVTASFKLNGAYQIRVRKLVGTNQIELSYLRSRATALTAELFASAGTSLTVGSSADLLPKLMGAIGTDTLDPAILTNLSDEDAANFSSAISDSIDHSLQAALDLSLTQQTSQQAVFQYLIDPARLDASSTVAVNHALRGDLSALTLLEPQAAADGTIAPGIKLLNSVLTDTHTRGVTFRVNLLGIVNVLSLSRLIEDCEILHEPITGDIVIKETSRSERLSAITNPVQRHDLLAKALYHAAMVTATYVVSKAVTLPNLAVDVVHFAEHRDTSRQNLADYLNWIAAVGLLSPADALAKSQQAQTGGRSTCYLRVSLDERASDSLFFDQSGALRTESEYGEIGRQALLSLLAASEEEIIRLRRTFLASDDRWSKALALGPNSALLDLLPVNAASPLRAPLLALVEGDLATIVWWASSMRSAGEALLAVRTFLENQHGPLDAHDPVFTAKREALHARLVGVVKNSRIRFDDPWGLVSLQRAASADRLTVHLSSASLHVDVENLPQPARAASNS